MKYFQDAHRRWHVLAGYLYVSSQSLKTFIYLCCAETSIYYLQGVGFSTNSKIPERNVLTTVNCYWVFWVLGCFFHFFFYNTDKQKEATLTKYSHICYCQTCTLLKLALYYRLPLCQIQNWWWYLPNENFLDVLSWCIWPLKDVVVYNEIFQSKKWRWL